MSRVANSNMAFCSIWHSLYDLRHHYFHEYSNTEAQPALSTTWKLIKRTKQLQELMNLRKLESDHGVDRIQLNLSHQYRYKTFTVYCESWDNFSGQEWQWCSPRGQALTSRPIFMALALALKVQPGLGFESCINNFLPSPSNSQPDYYY